MLHYEPVNEDGVLVIRPEGRLGADDFADLARALDSYLGRYRKLNGLLIDAPTFPGWDDFAALLAHLRFVRVHHRRIQRVAVVSDNALLELAPKLARYFINAQIQVFRSTDRASARAWLEFPATKLH